MVISRSVFEESEASLQQATHIENHPVQSHQESGLFSKVVTANELHSYEVIEKYRTQFLEGNPAIVFPIIREKKDQNFTITSPVHFHAEGAYEKNGEHYIYFFKGLERLRSLIRPQELQDTQMVDNDETFLPFLENTLKNLPDSITQQIDPTLFMEVLKKTQGVLPLIQQFPCHGDAHNENYSVSLLNNQPIVAFIDLENLGNYYRGWDEGRAYSKLSEHPEDQETFLAALNESNHLNKYEKIYFWRVVATRSLRRIYMLVHKQRQYKVLDDQKRNHLVRVNLQTLKDTLQILSQI